MDVIEEKGLDLRVFEMVAHGLLDFGQVVLVYDLVAFEVEGPITGAVEQRDRFLLAIDKPFYLEIVANALVPLRVNDADFRITDLPNLFLRLVIARTEGDNIFVHDRQDRPDRFHKRIAELLPIPQKGEPTDFHGAKTRSTHRQNQDFAAWEQVDTRLIPPPFESDRTTG